MFKLLRFIYKSILVVLILVLLWMNYTMYYSPSFEEKQGAVVNVDVYRQLNFLEARLKAGEGDEMQRLFPEGFVFINVLYGLTWTNLLQDMDPSTELFQKGIAEIGWALSELESEKCKQIFPKDLPLPYGAFHHGWTTYLLGSKLAVQPTSLRDSLEVLRFKQKCNAIVAALESSTLPYLESYHGQTWPADMMTSIASLKIHDTLFDEMYSIDRGSWVLASKEYLDPETGLIPHSISENEVVRYGQARGSSQSLILNFLYEIDEVYARDQHQIYRKLFLETTFGLPGVREYRVGEEGRGDIDSGPVVLDIGGAASIVGQRLAGKAGDWDTYVGLRNSIEMFGAAYTWGREKRYVFGKLPMVDAFVAWSNSIETSSGLVRAQSNWRKMFQAWSFVLMFGFLGSLFRGALKRLLNITQFDSRVKF